MAQNGPHGHQVGAAAAAAASADGHTAPPTTVAFSMMTSAGPYGNNGGGSSAGNNMDLDATSGMGKNLIPDLNMEERGSAGGSKDKQAKVVDADADKKGKSLAAADDGEPKDSIAVERERRKKMKDLFRSLQDVMPHVPQKTDKVTIVEEAIKYIKFLEEKAAILGKQKLEQELARQAAAGRGEASSASASFPFTVMPPQTAQGMAALYPASNVPLAGWDGVLPAVAPAMAAPPMRFKTWAGRNVVLTVTNDNAYISVCAPRRRGTLTMVAAVLENHGIEVITAQISSDRFRALFLIFAHVTRTNGMNRSSEEVYQRAVSEIVLRLMSRNT